MIFDWMIYQEYYICQFNLQNIEGFWIYDDLSMEMISYFINLYIHYHNFVIIDINYYDFILIH